MLYLRASYVRKSNKNYIFSVSSFIDNNIYDTLKHVNHEDIKSVDGDFYITMKDKNALIPVTVEKDDYYKIKCIVKDFGIYIKDCSKINNYNFIY